jgi:outer membrane receptor protein involved in Fe transport
VSFFGNPSGRDDLLEHSSVVTRNPAQTRWHVDEGAYDFSGKWTSKFNKGKTQIDAVAGYHRGYRNESTLDGNLGVQESPFVYYNYERSLYDFNDFEGGARIAKCQDSDDPSVDPYPNIVNCPVQDYAEGGLSSIEERTNARTSGSVSVTHRVKLKGYHVIKAGLDAEFPTYDSVGRYTSQQRWRRSEDTASGAPGRWQLREYYEVVRNLRDDEDPTTVDLMEGQELCANDRAICQQAHARVSDSTNRNLGAFIQDSWQVQPNLTLNVGLRWEQQVGYVAEQLQGQVSPEGEIIPARAFDLNDMFAPRIGFIYDPTREGKSKVFGHYGRFYENVPMDINTRAFGGEIINPNQYNFDRRTPRSSGYDPNCDVDHTPGETSQMLVSRISQCQDRFHQAIIGGGYEYVSPGLEGQRTDEIILGAEYEVIPNLTVGTNYVHRTLPTVIEDISTDGGNNYLITNPGESFDAEAAKLQKQADQLMASADEKDQALGELYALRAEQMAYVDQFQKPIRKYDGVQLTARQRPTRNSLLLASYTYSKTRGNYPGLFSTETTQEDPNLTSLYDLPELMANRYGPLGHDRPHLFKLDGFYLFDLKKAGQLTFGASWRTQSGIPHNALAAHVIYEDKESFLLPRGAMPRSPVTHNMDIRLAYGYKLNKTTTLEGFVNVFNLFDTQEELDSDEEYTQDAAQPVIDGTVEDLNHVKQIDFATGQELNTTVKKVGNFGNTTKRVSPRNVQIGFRLTF